MLAGQRVTHWLLCCTAAFLLLPGGMAAADENWDAVVAAARGQTVYFNAWGGELAINRYIEWAAEQVRAEYGIELRHVKVTDIAEAVSRIKAENAAGRDRDGSIDLLWINGENFASLQRAGLLYGPWVDSTPHAELINWEGNPTPLFDGAMATGGFELPWGTAALTLFYDSQQIKQPPDDPDALLQWIESHPGRFSYPQPPAFLGSAFLKQLLLVLVQDAERLQRPVGDDFSEVTQPLWSWLDRAHPHLWRRGRLFPLSGPAQRDLLAVGELDWMLSFNPSEASRAIGQGDLHETIGALHFAAGALANSHFLAIPYNASATAGARVTANFLLSPAAQARKANEKFWGDPTVLDIDKLGTAERRLFAALRTGAATPSRAHRYLSEPHPSWTTRLEQAWLERYVR